MVQVLPYVPSFGEKLAGVLGQAGGNIGEALVNKHYKNQANEKDQEILKKFGSESNLTPMQQIQTFASLSPDRQKSLSPLFSQLIKNQKGNADLQNQNEEKQIERGSIDRLRELKHQTGKTFGAVTGFNKIFNRGQLEDREEIDTTGLLLADKVFTKFNKGTISQAKLKLITEKLAINSGLNEREYEGRLKALERILNLPANASDAQVDNILNQEQKKENSKELERVKPGTQITDEIVDQLLDEFDSDVTKAQAKAKKLGYKF